MADSMTDPKYFRRDAGVPCPCCLQPQHSFESMQLHYKAHTEVEKEEAWSRTHQAFEKTLKERRHVFALVPVGER